jgi:adenylate cyclase
LKQADTTGLRKRDAGFSAKLRDIYHDILAAQTIERLPERVRAAIAAKDHTGEILIKLIQLSIVGVMGVIYFLSPKTSAGTDFSPVPMFLAAYMILNLNGLLWALRKPLPDWSVYVSIIFDFTLLYSLLWSFHIQYEQPASFALKAPALLYVFIFIALRALRFQARFVAAAGFVASLGWIAMILYVVMIDPGDNMLTRDYVTYLTSNTILIGAELDKIISILFVTAILAIAVRGGNNLLVRAISEQSAAQEFSRFFDQSVADEIRHSAELIKAGEGEKRDAAILNVDIRGFTRMAAQTEASQVMAILSAYQDRVVAIVQASGGTIDKFMGDGIMATFGATRPSATYAADALRAVDAILADIARWPAEDERLAWLGREPIGISVASGPIIFGAVGRENRLEFTVIGDAVNRSAKLEKHNKVLGTSAITDRQTFETALEQGYRPVNEPGFLSGQIEGMAGETDLVVLGPASADHAA